MKGFVRSARAVRAVAGVVAAEATQPITAEDVRQQEFDHHIGPGRRNVDVEADGPLVGLCLSGGGIRSATFGLGVLQALRSLGVFKQLDYISTVSGGGYIGGWLQGIIARGCVDEALPDETRQGAQIFGRIPDRFEARQIRFLRAFSNYLTPRLGLFSGDTWAAVGNTLRNLVLNLGVLSLSLIPPLYLPWLLVVIFWRLVPETPVPVFQLTCAALLLVTTVGLSAVNMSRPLADGSWDKPVGRQLATWQVLAFVVVPALGAVAIMSPIVWVWGVHHYFDDRLLRIVLWGGAAYGFINFFGVLFGYSLGRLLSGDAGGVKSDWGRAMRALGVLVITAVLSGAVGSFCGALASRGAIHWFNGTAYEWLVGLALFPIGVLSLLLCATIHIGLAGNWLSDEMREWWGRVGGVQLFLTGLLVILSFLSLAGPHLWSWWSVPEGLAIHAEKLNVIIGLLWVAVTSAGVVVGRSSRTNGNGTSVLERLSRLAPIVFVVGYLLILSTLLHHTVSQFLPPALNDQSTSNWSFAFEDVEQRLDQVLMFENSDDWNRGVDVPPLPAYEMSLAFMMLAFLGLAIRVSRCVDLNEFSLHAIYRNRIVRCYLGASNPSRSAHPFTGFDPRDDIPLRPRTANAAGLPKPIRPYPLFNVSMNLVAGKNLAWQERKAAAFVLAPEYCGFEYRIDEDDEQERKRRAVSETPAPMRRSAYASTADHGGEPRSITVGLAIATSGAAASPNMGYHSSPTLAFLMTVFNVRLGRWMRNPRFPVWKDKGARLSLRELMSELLGMTTDDRDWVYLSDGGHFENLGLYELVRRRCRLIIACDAGQDGAVTFEDLGNAIEKVRADFDINIEIDLSGVRRQATGVSTAHCAIGTIRYDQKNPDEPPGTLLYVKASMTGDEPADVLRYAATHPAFPHESTADQFFDESQFESYRALGYHIACTAMSAAAEPDEITDMSAVGLFTQLRQHWTLPAPAPTDAIRKYSAALSDIWTMVRTNEALKFLDPQMFPEWANLLIKGGEARAGFAQLSESDPQQVNYWLPESDEERRVGFYACNQMLQLMEDVYLEFKLDEHYDHIDNRGWMNLFQHWAWSGMLSATWSVTGSTYDPRFQRFCTRRLGLQLGKPYLFMTQEFILPVAADWRKVDFDKTAWLREWETGGARLNYWEVQLVDRFLSHSAAQEALQLIPIRVVTQSPRRNGDNLDFNVGYVIANVEWERRIFNLHHMRIQNHLRKMGLARQALRMVTAHGDDGNLTAAENEPSTRDKWGLKLAVVKPEDSMMSGGLRSDNMALDEALPSRLATNRLQRIISSLGR